MIIMPSSSVIVLTSMRRVRLAEVEDAKAHHERRPQQGGTGAVDGEAGKPAERHHEVGAGEDDDGGKHGGEVLLRPRRCA